MLDSIDLPRLIGLGYEAAADPTNWRTFTEELAVHTRSSVAIISCVDRIQRHRSFIVSGGYGDNFNDLLSADLEDSYHEYHYFNRTGTSPAEVPRPGDGIIGRNPGGRLAARATSHGPWPLEHFLCRCITADPDCLGHLTLGRTRFEPPFSETDLSLLGTPLLDNLQSSLKLGRALTALRESRSLMAAVMDTAPDGLVSFDRHGCVVTWNLTAAEVFAEHDGLELVDHRLRAARDDAQAAIDEALSAVLLSGEPTCPPITILVPRISRRQPYKLVLSPLPADGMPPSIGRAAMAMIYRRWQDSSATLTAMLRDTYGLTQAEIQLCKALFEGQTLSGASDRLQISRNTGKTHLAHIFDKTGLHSQASLMRFLAFGAQRR